MNEVILDSMLTCPYCDHAETVTMPTDACQFFYECKYCGILLKPKQGDCCVFSLTVRSNALTSNSINLVAPGNTTLLMG